MVQTMLLHLAVFLVVCAMVEVILPEGTLAPYIRFFVGLLTVSFLLTFGRGFAIQELWPDFSSATALDLENAEALAEKRVFALLQERISQDVLQNVAGCVEVRSVTVGEQGRITEMHLVVDRIVSRAEISERYGISSDNIILQGAAEP